MRRSILLIAIFALIVVPAGGSLAAGRQLTTQLTGAAEVPGPGDPDGSGSAHITVNSGIGQVCWRISVENITLPALAAHIHEAPVGVAGPVVVTLSPPDATGTSSGCADVDRSLAKDIRKHPAEYYVNVHTTGFEAGAVRGQLG